ncbi:MAG: hypothetical protein FWE80_08445, partial [Oscillospiraceae bacterium]|nr:hypothetical protein [Oscillospiraceae bacterium]
NGQRAGLAHFNSGSNHSLIRVEMRDGKKYIGDQEITVDSILLKTIVDLDRIATYCYSTDGGETYTDIGVRYRLVSANYRGDLIGIFTYNNTVTSATQPLNGFVDIEYFRYSYSRQASSNADRALPRDVVVQSDRQFSLINCRESVTLWLAPADTTVFIANDTMTRAASLTSINAPKTPGLYYLYEVRDGAVVSRSAASVTVADKIETPGQTVIEMEDYVWAVIQTHVGGSVWVNTGATMSGKFLDNTIVGDVYYLGKFDLTALTDITIHAGHADGGVQYVFYTGMTAGPRTPYIYTGGEQKYQNQRDKYTAAVTGGVGIATANCPSTGGWNNFTALTATMNESVTGEQELFMRIEGSGNYGGNLDRVVLTFVVK